MKTTYNNNELSDEQTVKAILNRDKEITFFYFYQKYYPLFNAIFNKYYTDCEDTTEFTNQIYVLIMTPGIESGKAPLETFGFRCTFGTWLKLVAENYCKQLFKKRLDVDESPEAGDRNPEDPVSPNLDSIDKHDVMVVLESMRNKRYREIIRLVYIEDKTLEEAAEILEMTMANFYNKHKLARKQFIDALKKEGLL